MKGESGDILEASSIASSQAEEFDIKIPSLERRKPGQAQWLTDGPAFLEVEAGRFHEVRSLRPAWPMW